MQLAEFIVTFSKMNDEISFFASAGNFDRAFEEAKNVWSGLIVLINNLYLVLCVYKLHIDYNVGKKENVENERYAQLVRRLERNEHDI